MALEDIKELFNSATKYSVVFYKLMDFTRQEKSLEDIYAESANYIEMKDSIHDVNTLLSWLEDAGAVSRRKEERQGEEIREYLTTTPDGTGYINEDNPKKRMADFLAKEEAYKSTIIDLIWFCAQPRTIPALEDRYSALDMIKKGKITPNYIVMELEKAGVLEWRDGWVTTEFGKEYV